MKNRIILIGTMFIIIILGTLNVHAEETTTQTEGVIPQSEEIAPQTGTQTWPQTLTYKDFEYTIEGVELRVYKMNSENKTTTTTEENGVTTTITKSIDGEKYMRGEATRIIELSPTEYTINPEYKEDKLNDYKTTFINLNLSITPEKLTKLLNDEYNQVTKEISFITDIVVKYKLTKAPAAYQYFKNINTIREFYKLFVPDIELPDSTTTLNKTNSQVFNIVTIGMNEDGSKGFNYESRLSETSSNAIFSINYLAMSSNNDDIEELIMFHNYENIEYLIENLKKIEDDAEEQIKDISTITTPDNSQVVSVDNTAVEIPKYVYIMSILAIMTGAIAIVIVHSKKGEYVC